MRYCVAPVRFLLCVLVFYCMDIAVVNILEFASKDSLMRDLLDSELAKKLQAHTSESN